jgi:hypothetical protein
VVANPGGSTDDDFTSRLADAKAVVDVLEVEGEVLAEAPELLPGAAIEQHGCAADGLARLAVSSRVVALHADPSAGPVDLDARELNGAPMPLLQDRADYCNTGSSQRLSQRVQRAVEYLGVVVE